MSWGQTRAPGLSAPSSREAAGPERVGGAPQIELHVSLRNTLYSSITVGDVHCMSSYH